MTSWRVAVPALLATALLGWASPRLAAFRPAPVDVRAGVVVVVESPADRGEGSLRDAILRADRERERVRIEVRVPRIRLVDGLPPLLNPAGIVLVGDVVLDASEVVGTAPILDLAGGGDRVEGITVVGARGPAIRVRAGPASLRRVGILDSGVGLEVLPTTGGAVDGEDLDLAGNELGVRWWGEPDLVLNGLRTRGHRRAAVWAVGEDGDRGRMVLRDAVSTADRIGVVAAGPVRVEVRSSRFQDSELAALSVDGARCEIEETRVVASRTVGIRIERTTGVRLLGTEIQGGAGVGILLHGSHNGLLRGNRLHRNAVGLALVGSSGDRLEENVFLAQTGDAIQVWDSDPLILRNVVRDSGGAALRLQTGSEGEREPLLRANLWAGNGTDAVTTAPEGEEEPR